jgi:hypothetical protein
MGRAQQFLLIGMLQRAQHSTLNMGSPDSMPEWVAI